jgi:8-oxo-dGTP pyrophosphatase MutT (NUDIX family)
MMQAGVKVMIRRKDTQLWLFVLRDDSPEIAEPNTWSLIGGGKEEGETPEEAIRREAWEEIGSELFGLQYIDERVLTVMVNGKEEQGKLSLFVAEIDLPLEEIILTEGQRLIYCTREEIMTYPNRSQVLNVALEYSY